MAIATFERPDEAAPGRGVVRPAPRHRRRRVAALLVAGAVVLVGLGGYGAVQASDDAGPSRGWDAWSRRLEAEADAYLAVQGNLARGRAADSARLQAAADAFAEEQANLARGRAADAARLQAAADAGG